MLCLYDFLVWELQAKCIDLAVAILYIVLVSVFFGWGLFHRTRKANPASVTKPWWTVMDDSEVHSVNREKNENPPMQVKTNFVSKYVYINYVCSEIYISYVMCMVWKFKFTSVFYDLMVCVLLAGHLHSIYLLRFMDHICHFWTHRPQSWNHVWFFPFCCHFYDHCKFLFFGQV